MVNFMNCDDCNEPFEPKILTVCGMEIFRQRYCPACIAIQETKLTAHWAAEHAAHLSARDATWQAICGEEYRTASEGGKTDEKRLAAECPKLRSVTDWQLDGKGLLIHGKTGRGKTRAVWRLLRKVHDAGGVIKAMTSGDFARQFADAAGNHYRMAWFSGLAHAAALFIDDLGKSKWTPGAWGEFFEIIEARGRTNRATILTMNETSETLKEKVQDVELWAALKRRLEEFRRITL